MYFFTGDRVVENGPGRTVSRFCFRVCFRFLGLNRKCAPQAHSDRGRQKPEDGSQRIDKTCSISYNKRAEGACTSSGHTRNIDMTESLLLQALNLVSVSKCQIESQLADLECKTFQSIQEMIEALTKVSKIPCCVPKPHSSPWNPQAPAKNWSPVQPTLIVLILLPMLWKITHTATHPWTPT